MQGSAEEEARINNKSMSESNQEYQTMLQQKS